MPIDHENKWKRYKTWITCMILQMLSSAHKNQHFKKQSVYEDSS
jgi:hypothetical protein